MQSRLLLVVAVVAAAPLMAAEPQTSPASAQPTPAPRGIAPPRAADPAAPAPGAAYRSAFDGYRGFRDEPIADWRVLNDEVGRIGGHIGIMRGSAGAAAPTVTTEGGQAPVRAAPKAPGTPSQGHH